MITVTYTFPEWAVVVFACFVVGISLLVAGLAIWEKWELHLMRKTLRTTQPRPVPTVPSVEEVKSLLRSADKGYWTDDMLANAMVELLKRQEGRP